MREITQLPAHLEEQLTAADRRAGDAETILDGDQRFVVGEELEPPGEAAKMTPCRP